MSRKSSIVRRLVTAGLVCWVALFSAFGGVPLALADTVPAQAMEIRFAIGERRYFVNGAERLMDASPFVKEDRTYVPVRYLAEPMGALVGWEGPLQRVTLTFPGKRVELFIGRPVVVVNGEEKPIPVAPLGKEGRTYLPARFVAEAFGYKVDWEPRTHTVVISRADWANPYSLWVFGQPPLEYLKEVGATGTAWSVFFWGRNPEEEAYVRQLHGAGYRVLSNLPSEQGSQWLSEEGWKGLDPALIEAGACRRNDGSIVYFDLGSDKIRSAYMDHNSPAWQNYLETMVKEHIEGGADGILIDGLQGPAVSVFYGGNFSPNTMAGFRDHLARKFFPDVLVAKFGINDINNFDYGRYLAAKGIKSAYDDPNRELLQEYLRFMYASRISYLKKLVGQAKEQGGPNLIIAGNAYQFGPSYQPILPLLDLVVSELPMGTLPEGKQAGLYLLAKSIVGPKPVIGFPDINSMANFPAQDYGLWRHWLAEALSCGGTLMLPHNAFTMGAGSFTLPAGVIAPYTRFLHAHPEVYTREARSLARVAVLYDLGSTLFDWNAWQGYVDMTKALQEQHIPYDVLFLGDGELATGGVSEKDLKPYSAIVIPPLHKALAAEESLSAYAASGGHVLWVQPGTLGQVASLLRNMGVNPGLETDASPSLGIFPYVTPWGGGVHLVNYAYDYSRHDFQPQTNITVKVAVPAGVDVSGMTLKLMSPDGKDGPWETVLPWRLEGGMIAFTVPEVYSYAVVALGR